MPKQSFILIYGALIFFSLGKPAFSETIYLKSGKILEGTVIEDDGSVIKLKTGNQAIKIKKSLIATDYEEFQKLQDEKSALENRILDRKVELYVRDNCAACAKLEYLLKRYKIPYTKYNVERNYTGREKYKQFGRVRLVPILKIDEQVVEGYNPELTIQLLTGEEVQSPQNLNF